MPNGAYFCQLQMTVPRYHILLLQLSDEAAALLQDALQSFVLYCKPRIQAPQVRMPDQLRPRYT